MSDEMNETIPNIIADMKANNRLCVSPLFIYDYDGGVDFSPLIERLDAAYKRHLTAGTMCSLSCRTDGELLEQYAASEKRLSVECARLREALKPILEVRTEKSWTVDKKDGSTVFYDRYGVEAFVTAVRKAQEVMAGFTAWKGCVK